MAKDPAFPMYASDWLGSSQIALMSAEQERGYLRLLCHMWSCDCALRDDDQVLAKLSLMNEGWLNGGSQLVRECFIVHPEKPGYITHEKLLVIKAERDKWRVKSSEGGKKSAQLRKSGRGLKGGTKGGSTTVGAKTSTSTQRKGNSPFLSSSSSSSSKEELPPKVPQGGRPYSKQFLEFWEAYPRKEGKQKAHRYWRSAVKQVRVERNVEWQAATDFILEATRAFAGTPLGTGDFCPHPATWLNGGRYDDEREAWNRVRERRSKTDPPLYRFGEGA